MGVRTLALVLVLLLLILVGGFVASRLLDQPTEFGPPGPSGSKAGLLVQESLAELLLRQAGVSGRADPIVVPTPALNEFLGHHLQTRRLPVQRLQVRVGDGWVELAGRSTPRRLFGASASRGPAALLPDAILDYDLWLSLRGRLVVRDGYGELVVDGAGVGRQPIPAAWLSWILGISPGELLTWRLPRIVEKFELEPGRVIIYTRRRGR